MSRHEFLSDDQQHLVAVGWDPGLDTYFGQVMPGPVDDCDDTDLLLWVGTTPNEIRTVSALMLRLQPHVNAISQQLWYDLLSDKSAAVDSRRSL